MATAASLAGIEWLRTYASSLLTRCARPTDASTVRGSQTITTTTRMNTLSNRLATYETSVRTDYVQAVDPTTWDALWEQASTLVFDEVAAGCPTPLSAIKTDPDRNAAICLLRALRALELAATRYLVEGGTL